MTVFPTKSEFNTAKIRFIETMNQIMKQNYTINNPKLDEVVARSHFNIENGYQSLVAHWKKYSLDDVVLPDNAPTEVFLFVDSDGGLWPYHGKVELLRRSLEIEHNCFNTNDREEFVNGVKDGLCDNELDTESIKVFRKFYDVEWVGIGYTGDSGSVFCWAGYEHAQSELVDYGLIEEFESIDHYTIRMDSDVAVIKLTKK